MSTTGGWGKGIAVLGLFLFLLFWGYFWPFHVGLDDVRQHLPSFLDDQVQGVLDRLPPDKADNLQLPLPEVKYQCDFYYDSVVSRGEYNATGWILNNTKKSDKFVADIFGAELIMGMTCRVSTVGGDWANAPDPVKVMTDTNTIYTTSDPWQAYNLARSDNCTYVWLPDRNTFSGYDWVYGEHDKFNDQQYFRLVYENDDVKIYKILELTA